jgi:import inner membrane translocase subunit TIM50
MQPENAIVLPKWDGNPNDTGLIALIPFLEYVANIPLSDTRKVLESFKDKDIPTEFAAREAAARERWNAQLAASKSRNRHSSGSGLFGSIGSALGIKPGAGMMPAEEGVMSASESWEQGKMWSDRIREQGQKQYEHMAKQIEEHGEQWLKEMAADEKKAMEEAMKGMQTGFMGGLGGGWFGGGGKKE